MNLTGLWKYKEDFEYGKSEGEVRLVQMKDSLHGDFIFTEKVENGDKDDYEIEVVEKVKGKIVEGTVLLESMEVEAKQGSETIDYIANNFDVHIVSETKLVGSSFDKDNVCGVFTLEKIL